MKLGEKDDDDDKGQMVGTRATDRPLREGERELLQHRYTEPGSPSGGDAAI